jgi:predicted 3-demethylubiquinone-9 3-methyltransferase (glyoxalase superfamily)
MPRVTPFLWFDTQAEEAARFYTSVFPNSRIVSVTHYIEGAPRPAGSVMTVAFELDGQPFTALNGGPHFQFNEAVSFVIDCETQDEVDAYWAKLTADGGQEGQCGWLKDKYGVSWQVIPKDLGKVFGGDPEGSKRAMQAMLRMRKLDVGALKRAYEGALE